MNKDLIINEKEIEDRFNKIEEKFLEIKKRQENEWEWKTQLEIEQLKLHQKFNDLEKKVEIIEKRLGSYKEYVNLNNEPRYHTIEDRLESLEEIKK